MLNNLSVFDSIEELLPYLLAFLLALAIAMSIHEFAHAKVAYILGDDTAKLKGRLTLNPLAHISPIGLVCFLLVGYGWATPVPVNPLRFKKYRLGMFLVSIAGVITNFIFAFMLTGIASFCLTSNFFFKLPSFIVSFFIYFFTISITMNITLFFFNLIPIPPLDGFNMINSFSSQGNKVVNFLTNYGIAIFLGFIMISYLFPNFSILSTLTYWVEDCFYNFWTNVLII